MRQHSKLVDVKLNCWLLVGGSIVWAIGYWTFNPHDTSIVCASRCARGDVLAKALMLFGGIAALVGVKGFYNMLAKK